MEVCPKCKGRKYIYTRIGRRRCDVCLTWHGIPEESKERIYGPRRRIV